MAGSDEYCTPEYIIDAARKVIGRNFDFDPASNDFAQKYIRATVYRTIADEGTPKDSLSMDWRCFDAIWLNPPYSLPKVQQFVAKFAEWTTNSSNNQQHGFVLVNSKTETRWYQSLLKSCYCCCFFDKRISFVKDGVSLDQNRQPQTLFYFGESLELFESVFSSYGFCCFL